jgi:hypothetical protein
MFRRTVPPARYSARLPALLALILALACQVASGTLLSAQTAAAAPSQALAAVTILCQFGHHPAQRAPAPHHHVTQAALIRAAAANATHAAPGAAPPTVPAPTILRQAEARLPPARAPPAHPAPTPYPTGPPTLV